MLFRPLLSSCDLILLLHLVFVLIEFKNNDSILDQIPLFTK